MKNMLKIKRWQAGLKQYELAEILDCSPPYLSMIETGRVEAPEEFKRKVADVFDTTVEEIFPERHRINVFK